MEDNLPEYVQKVEETKAVCETIQNRSSCVKAIDLAAMKE